MERGGVGLMRGRMGARGVIRTTDEGRKISAQGFKAGEEAALYVLADGAARRCSQATADAGGAACLTAAERGMAFVAVGNEVRLWEGGDRPEEAYLACCAGLRKLRQGAKAAAPRPPAAGDAPAPSEAPAPPEAPAPEETTWRLRPPSAGAPVDGLPVLVWPRGTEAVRAYFDALPPFAPFYAPGWRFVRAPSPLPGTAYCAVGRLAQDGRVVRLAYALPGVPQRPPAALPGYRYRQGFWVLEQPVG